MATEPESAASVCVVQDASQTRIHHPSTYGAHEIESSFVGVLTAAWRLDSWIQMATEKAWASYEGSRDPPPDIGRTTKQSLDDPTCSSAIELRFR